MKYSYPYPVFLNLCDKKCIVVGGGSVASRKIPDLLDTGADITVIAEQTHERIRELIKNGMITWIPRNFLPEDINNVFLVIVATDDTATNGEIAKIAQERGVLVNAVDNPANCDFFSGAMVRRGPLRIAVSTSGYCPGFAGTIRRELEKHYDDSIGDFILAAGEMRNRILAVQDPVKKDMALRWLCDRETYTLYLQSGKEKVWEKLTEILSF